MFTIKIEHLHLQIVAPSDKIDDILRIVKETQKNMATEQQLLDAVDAAVTAVNDATKAAVAKETAEVVAQITAILGTQGVSQATIDAVVAKVTGISTNVASQIDSISDNDGAVPPPPPPPPQP